MQAFERDSPKYSQMLRFVYKVFRHQDLFDVINVRVSQQSRFRPRRCTVSGLKHQYLFHEPTPPPTIKTPKICHFVFS